MNDSAPSSETVAESTEPSCEGVETAAPQVPARRPRYRPSEAWALRWLGPPTAATP